MSFPRSIPIVAVALLSNTLLLTPASAQFGVGLPGQNLPQYDFTWTWGRDVDAGGIDDFSMIGNDGFFRCALTGRLRVGSRLSRNDVRQLEDSIRNDLSFVRAANNAMYTLESRGELDWATLDCAKPQPTEADQAKRDEREARAREKAARERERRRARRQREEESQ